MPFRSGCPWLVVSLAFAASNLWGCAGDAFTTEVQTTSGGAGTTSSDVGGVNSGGQPKADAGQVAPAQGGEVAGSGAVVSGEAGVVTGGAPSGGAPIVGGTASGGKAPTNGGGVIEAGASGAGLDEAGQGGTDHPTGGSGTPEAGSSGATDTGGAESGGTSAGASGQSGAGTSGAAEGGAEPTGGDGGNGGNGADGANAGGGAGGQSAACNTETFDPCAIIPAFEGTQVVDGDGEDFCALPSFEFRLVDGEYVSDEDGRIDPDTISPELPNRATVWVAWSTEGLHVYARVYDPNVFANLYTVWEGDAVEFYVSGRAPTGTVTGGYPTTNAPFQVLLGAPDDRGRSIAAYKNDDPFTGEFASVLTEDGFAVEALIGWPYLVNITSGSTLGFDMALDAALTRQARDYQGVMVYDCVTSTCDQAYETASVWCSPVAE